MKLPDPRTFSKICANLFDCKNGEVFLEYLRQKLTLESYDAINPHNTSRNEGYRAAFREILKYNSDGKDPNAFQEEAET